MRHTAGVVQIALLPGLLLLTLVIAAIAWLSQRNADSTPDTEDALQAMAILVQGASLQTALSRALADGAVEPQARGILDLTVMLTATGVMASDTLPQPPKDALTQATQWSYAQHYFRAMDAREPAVDLGTDLKDSVLYLPHLTPSVCAHINYRLFGAPTQLARDGEYPVAGELDEESQLLTGAHGAVPATAQAAAREGCINYHGSGYTYYKVIGVY